MDVVGPRDLAGHDFTDPFLEKNGVPCEGYIRTFRPHGWLRNNFLEWMADSMADFVKKGYLK